MTDIQITGRQTPVVLKDILRNSCVEIVGHKDAHGTVHDVLMWHEQLEIKLFYSAGTQLVIGNQVYYSQVGDIYVVNSCEPHTTKAEHYSDYHLLIIDVSKLIPSGDSIARKKLEAICTGELTFASQIRRDPVLQQHIERYVQYFMEGGKADDLAGMALLYLILEDLLKYEQREKDNKLSFKHITELTEKLAPAFELMNRRFSESISVAELAEACSISEKYFCKLFKARTGMSAVSYIQQLRVNKAAVLLRSTNHTIAEIAGECGYADLGYFGRIFAKIKGCSPMKYRSGREIGMTN